MLSSRGRRTSISSRRGGGGGSSANYAAKPPVEHYHYALASRNLSGVSKAGIPFPNKKALAGRLISGKTLVGSS